METGLAGKRVLVTGASGGIGSACARAFAEEGADLVLHFHRGKERAEELVSEEQVGRISRTMALRKVALPEDVPRQLVVLASPLLSGHVTGQVVTVAGGMEGRVIHD